MPLPSPLRDDLSAGFAFLLKGLQFRDHDGEQLQDDR
jgi:hypothetical protein